MVLDAFPEHVEQPVVGDRPVELLGEAALSGLLVTAVEGDQVVPLCLLGRTDEGEELSGVQADRRAVVGVAASLPTVAAQRVDDRFLELRLVMGRAHDAPSSIPRPPAVETSI